MKWDRPKPIPPTVIISKSETTEEFIQSENDPAFSDFNLPLLDQQPVGFRWSKERHHIPPLRGWASPN